LDFALLLPSDSFRALENVGFMRHATDKLPVILSVIEAGLDHLHDEVSKRTTCRIRPGVGKISQAAKSLCINQGKKRRQDFEKLSSRSKIFRSQLAYNARSRVDPYLMYGRFWRPAFFMLGLFNSVFHSIC
jgi:hypothetical protein